MGQRSSKIPIILKNSPKTPPPSPNKLNAEESSSYYNHSKPISITNHDNNNTYFKYECNTTPATTTTANPT
jgi:hypothetical protein